MTLLQRNAVKISKRLRNQPRHPVELAADVVERVLATDGDDFLATHEHMLSWWQLSLLDVKLLLLSVAMLLLGLTAILFCGLVMGLLSAGKRLLHESRGGADGHLKKAA